MGSSGRPSILPWTTAPGQPLPPSRPSSAIRRIARSAILCEVCRTAVESRHTPYHHADSTTLRGAGSQGKSATQTLLHTLLACKAAWLGLCGLADTCAAWERRVSMEKEKNLMRQYQESVRLHHCVGCLA